MARNRIISDEKAADVVKAYTDGEKVSAIAERLGMAVSTVYWVLEREGVAPSRAKRKARYATEDAEPLYTAIAEQEELIAALEAEVIELRRQLRAHEGND